MILLHAVTKIQPINSVHLYPLLNLHHSFLASINYEAISNAIASWTAHRPALDIYFHYGYFVDQIPGSVAWEKAIEEISEKMKVRQKLIEFDGESFITYAFE
jgi:hypothetical protein